MLKFDGFMLIAITLMLFPDSANYLAMFLAFLAGLSISTGRELYKSTFTWTKFGIRLLYVFGLAVIGGFIWQDYAIKMNIVYYIVAITLFPDLIVMMGYMVGTFLIKKWFNQYRNENEQ